MLATGYSAAPSRSEGGAWPSRSLFYDPPRIPRVPVHITSSRQSPELTEGISLLGSSQQRDLDTKNKTSHCGWLLRPRWQRTRRASDRSCRSGFHCPRPDRAKNMKAFKSYFSASGAGIAGDDGAGWRDLSPARQSVQTRPLRGKTREVLHRYKPPPSRKHRQLPSWAASISSPDTPRSAATPQPPAGSEYSLPQGLPSELHPNSAAQTPHDGSTSNLSSAARSRSSRQFSSRNSIFPLGDLRNSDSGALNDLRNDMMVNSLHEEQLRKQYARARTS